MEEVNPEEYKLLQAIIENYQGLGAGASTGSSDDDSDSSSDRTPSKKYVSGSKGPKPKNRSYVMAEVPVVASVIPPVVIDSDDDDDSRLSSDETEFDGDNFSLRLHGREIIDVSRVLNLQFGDGLVQEVIYRVQLNDEFSNSRFIDIMGSLHVVFTSILERLNQRYRPTDIARVFINNEKFHVPLSTGLMALRDMTVSKIMDMLEAVLQSDEDLFIEQGIEIHVAVARNPLGGKGGKLRYLFTEIDDLSKSRSIVKIVNKDNLCFARSVVVALAKLKLSELNRDDDEREHDRARTDFNTLTHHQSIEQTVRARALHEQLDLPMDSPISVADIPKFEEHLNVDFVILAPHLNYKPWYTSHKAGERRIYMLFVKVSPSQPDDNIGHFHPVTKISGLFKGKGFCHTCLSPYIKQKGHSCIDSCKVCQHQPCIIIKGQCKICNVCNRFVKSVECYERHIRNGECETIHRCKRCSRLYKTCDEHICDRRKCKICEKNVSGTHLCYIRSQKPRDVSEKYIFADFEADPTGSEHSANLVVANWQCENCSSKSYREQPYCEHCGMPCSNCINAIDNLKKGDTERAVCMATPGCGKRQIMFFGHNIIEKFAQFLFHPQHEGYTLVFHNGQAYDVYFLLKYLFSSGIKPRLIYRGSKVVYVDTGVMRIIDSLNFLPMALSQMPKVFNLSNIRKGTFPVFFNKPENWGYKGPLPPMEMYGVNKMSTKAREDFITWYNDQNGYVFDFKAEIIDYCKDDVCILEESCNAFRRWLIDLTASTEVLDVGEQGERTTKVIAVDPLQYTTLASVCMAVYRHMFLEERYEVTLDDGRSVMGYLKRDEWSMRDENGRVIDETEVTIATKSFHSTAFARMPSCGFGGVDTHSRDSILWLEYEAYRRDINIRHARNGGEVTVPSSLGVGFYKLDGYYQDPGTGAVTCYEYMGCLWHGCPKCYGRKTGTSKQVRHPHTGQSMQELYSLAMVKLTYLKNVLHYRVVVMWECDFKVMLKNDLALSRFALEKNIAEPLEPRDAFYGGRTNAVHLHAKAKDDIKIGYADICSLYPMVLKNDVFPEGMPEILLNPDDLNIDKYFGVAHVKVRPPRGLFHPYLPMRCHGKLFFPLCRNCMEKLSTGPCICSDDLRDLIGTWTTVDLTEAIRLGYTILVIYEVYDFKKRRQFNKTEGIPGLFEEYINLFLKGKQEASGWPRDAESLEDRERYLRDYLAVEGISLDPSNIEHNPNKRTLCKLLLNSYWGKYGEISNHKQTEIVHDEKELFSMLTNPTLSIKDMHVVSASSLMLEYEHKRDFVPEMGHTNIFIAAFTTANARKRLYSVLERLGRNAIYFDTDSVIYYYDESDPNAYHPPLGEQLGDWTNELDQNDFISEFVSTGGKSYAYTTNLGKTVCKVKGFSLNHMISQSINFESVKKLVLYWANPDKFPLDEGEEDRIEIKYERICRNKATMQLFTKAELKKFGVTYNKRVLEPEGFCTLPYGY